MKTQIKTMKEEERKAWVVYQKYMSNIKTITKYNGNKISKKLYNNIYLRG